MSTSTSTHPELQDGEVFVSNIEKPRSLGEVADDESLPFTSKRRGNNAYDDEGNIIPGYYPVFVMQSEVIARGGDPDDPMGFKIFCAEHGI
jgi:hypothetical protein